MASSASLIDWREGCPDFRHLDHRHKNAGRPHGGPTATLIDAADPLFARLRTRPRKNAGGMYGLAERTS